MQKKKFSKDYFINENLEHKGNELRAKMQLKIGIPDEKHISDKNDHKKSNLSNHRFTESNMTNKDYSDYSNNFSENPLSQSLISRESPKERLETHLLSESFDRKLLSKDLEYSVSIEKSPIFSETNFLNAQERNSPSSISKYKKLQQRKSRESFERLMKPHDKGDGCEVCIKVHHHKWAISQISK